MLGLEALNDVYSQDLAALLSQDEPLAKALASPLRPVTGEEMLQETVAWCERCHAATYAIVRDGRAVGLVSLSQQDLTHGTARVGIWIGSAFWSQGIATAVGPLLRTKAKAKGIHRLTAQIAQDNERSKAVWLKFGGRLVRDGAVFRAVLDLT